MEAAGGGNFTLTCNSLSGSQFQLRYESEDTVLIC